MIKRLDRYKIFRKIVASFLFISVIASIYLWIDLGLSLWTLLLSVASLLMGGLLIIVHREIVKIRNNIRKMPSEHRGHQDEPGSWQCSCGRYNTSYRSVCLTCGKPKPGTTLYDN
jgi:hypothetical protein